MGSSVRVWVNGDLVNDGYDATADSGRIALQFEGSEVEFRKVAITPIARSDRWSSEREAVPPAKS